MAAKKFKPPHFASMQPVELEMVTDPAELAYYEERRKRGEELMRAARRRKSLRLLTDLTVAEVLKLARRLSAEKRVVLITKLASRLSEGKRLKLVEQLTTSPTNGTRLKAAPSKRAIKDVRRGSGAEKTGSRGR